MRSRTGRFLVDLMQKLLALARFWRALRAARKAAQTNHDLLSKKTLIVGGRGMGPVWGQIWTLLLAHTQFDPKCIIVVDSRKFSWFNIYLRLLGARLVSLPELISDHHVPSNVACDLQIDPGNTSLIQIRKITLRNVPLGDIAMSTYCRHHATGYVALSSEAIAEIQFWITHNARIVIGIENFIKAEQVELAFATELFLEEYGAIAFSLVEAGVDLVRFAGTTRDDSLLIERVSPSTIRRHHAAISPSVKTIINRIPTAKITQALDDELNNRYSGKWHRAKRNLTSTSVLDRAQARAKLDIDKNDIVAVVFSHILYDSLFFYGADLFDTYADWLEHTVNAAIKNTKVKWFIKVHPSNMWRGELETYLNGEYEEERIIRRICDRLPSHINIVKADNDWSPMTWVNLADIGITVRGTAGIEMAVSGKHVVTAGKGRYEDAGFSILPNARHDYLQLLSCLQECGKPDPQAAENAKKYLFGLYCLRSFRVPGLQVSIAPLTNRVKSSEDLIYIPIPISTAQDNSRVKHIVDFFLNREIEQLIEPLYLEGVSDEHYGKQHA